MQMRRIDPNRFHVATRGTSRRINRQIALTLIGSHQPISRADLARRMKMRRGAVGLLVQELLDGQHIVEGTTGAGRARPQADDALHQRAAAVERRRGHSRQPDLRDDRRPDGPAAVGHCQHGDGARSRGDS